jgi:hypothetical protein
MKRHPFSLAFVLVLPAFAMAVEHAHEVWGGWVECDRGYVMASNECISESDAVEQKVVVSDLPSAGDGAPGTCPSGGCGYSMAPSFYSVYSAPAYGGDWSTGYYGGWNSGGWSRSRSFRGGESPWPTGRFAAAGGFTFGPRRFHSMPEQRSDPGFAGGRFFGGGQHVSRGQGRRR